MTFINIPLLNHLKLISKLKFIDINLTGDTFLSLKCEV